MCGQTSTASGATRCDGELDDGTVLFDDCRFPRLGQDLLDCVVGQEPSREGEGPGRQPVRIVGEAGALKRLLSLPLQGPVEAVSLHRVGDCLVVCDTAEEFSDTFGGSTSSSADSARLGAAVRCIARVEGDVVRVYPRTESAEPVDLDTPPAAAAPLGACCEWRVREGLSLLAVVPQSIHPGGPCDLADLRSSPPQLLGPRSKAGAGIAAVEQLLAGDIEQWHPGARRASLPHYHRSVTEDQMAVLVVPVHNALDQATLVDAWLSCCLLGSPSLLCFFVDSEGVCRGSRFVPAADIPVLGTIAQAYRKEQRCLPRMPSEPPEGGQVREPDLDAKAFDPRGLRQLSHALLEGLVERCGRDGGHCLVLPSPFGLRLFGATEQGSDDGEDSAEEDAAQVPILDLRLDLPELLLESAADKRALSLGKNWEATPSVGDLAERLRRLHVTQALLMYHAAVRLAQPLRAQEPTLGSLKEVPVGTRWTAKSCRHPLRVRQMMLRAVRAVRAAAAVHVDSVEVGPGARGASLPPLHSRFLLLLASANEFLADTFLAEDTQGDDASELSRYLTALRYLVKSCQHLSEYCTAPVDSDGGKDFAQSVRRLEERVITKQTNVHLSLARLRQRQPWCSGEPPLRAVALAMQELDAAEALVSQPPRVAQPQRQLGPHECCLLASISKWKADLLFELATLAAPAALPGGDVEPQVREYLEVQQRDMAESSQPLPAQCERWLQSTISLCLRGLHHLAGVPHEVTEELQAQARALLARAYGKLGHIYACTGRYTKAMTHAKQGIELFNATRDQLHAAKLQLWLCRLQLRLALSQAMPAAACAPDGGLQDQALLRGLGAANGAEAAACAQVATALQKALKGLEGGEGAERELARDGQALLGHVLLRRGLVLLMSATPACPAWRLCEEESALPSILELLQANESPGMDSARKAVELLLQASAHFKDAQEPLLNGIAHACLAAVYFCGPNDPRGQRLALSHCQYAKECLGTGAFGFGQRPALWLAVSLLEAKALRRNATKGSDIRVGEMRAVAVLCTVALHCLRVRDIRGAWCAAQRHDGQPDSAELHEEEDQLRSALLKGDEQNLPLMSYIRAELNDLLLRLLRCNERQGGGTIRELKALYCSLVTAWHSDAGQVDALVALRDHMHGSVALSTA